MTVVRLLVQAAFFLSCLLFSYFLSRYLAQLCSIFAVMLRSATEYLSCACLGITFGGIIIGKRHEIESKSQRALWISQWNQTSM